MAQIQFFTTEQEARIPEYQEKWRRVDLATQPIDRNRATDAIERAYTVMATKPPERIIFCASPREAFVQLQASIDRVEIPAIDSAQERPNIFGAIAQAGWEIIKIRVKQKFAGSKPLQDLVAAATGDAGKTLTQLIDRALPQDLTTKDIVEQAVGGTSPFFEKMARESSRQGDPELLKNLQEQPLPERQETFNMTADALEAQLAWLPAKGFLFRGWLKGILQNTLSFKIAGIEHPKFSETILSALSLSAQAGKFLIENPPIIISNLIISCTIADFIFSELNAESIPSKWLNLQNLVRECGWIFVADDVCIVCDRPTKILLDQERQLHGDGEPALVYADGFVVYAHHGMPLPERYGSIRSSEWQSAWILTAESREIQQVLMQSIGAIRVCQELPTTELDRQAAYTLLQLDNIGDRENRIFKYVNPDTNALDAIFVPWNISSVKSAIRFADEHFPDRFPLVPTDSTAE
jgi:hypothetical protein